MQISSSQVLHLLPDINETGSSRLKLRVDQSIKVLRRAVDEHGLDRWVIMFSGGKDSTTALILALEAAKQSGKVERIDVIFSNTGVEIPTIEAHAFTFLDNLRCEGINLHKHVVSPLNEHGFWALIIGKGSLW
jgi:DNA sulfur modification protein DndC